MKTHSDELFQSRDVHVYGKGFFGPPHAINLFIPLKSLNLQNGPTEFTLGSHMWGDEWYEWEQDEKPLNDIKFVNNVPGTFVFSDYRTSGCVFECEAGDVLQLNK
jgi:ectoine hydroxylase-related dioxygenase (phytanoyl-CoA dioxygenase family)